MGRRQCAVEIMVVKVGISESDIEGLRCRFCRSTRVSEILDLGYSPPANAYRNTSDLRLEEVNIPLHLFVCNDCDLVQVGVYCLPEELFTADYAYLSSSSSTWVAHAKDYARDMIELLGLDESSLVTEVACNDGYLLEHFVASDIACLGVEPTLLAASIARSKGIHVLDEFFGEEVATSIGVEYGRSDLVVCNNVLAHVPDIADFLKGILHVLKPDGTVTVEFPHVFRLLESSQFDTIYHEHYSYFSLKFIVNSFEKCGLRVWRVDELDTHGGSLRVFAGHKQRIEHQQESVNRILEIERKLLDDPSTFNDFRSNIEKIKLDLLEFLISSKRAGKRVAGFGAAAKGNTLLNFAGIKRDLIDCVYDNAPSKQGKHLPGSAIPVKAPQYLVLDKPDYLIIFPWNLTEEIRSEIALVADWEIQFVTAVPSLQVFR